MYLASFMQILMKDWDIAMPFPMWLPSFMRDEPLMRQISGLVLCSKTHFSFK